MNIKLLSSRSVLVLLIVLLPLSFFAQQSNYDWSWAVRGGGSRNLTSSNYPGPDDMQRIQNISIDSHNNYYFLAQIGGESSLGSAPTFGNVPNDTIAINDYSEPVNQPYPERARNTYLVSTNCQGDFRWHKSIGGTDDIFAYGVGVDGLGGVYVAGYAYQSAYSDVPLHYDQDSIKTAPNEKTMYLIKYDTLGDFQWLKEPQPDLADPDWGFASSVEIFVEDNGTVHWMVTLDAGSSIENGTVVAEDNYFALTDSQVGDLGILKYDKDGNFIDYTRLDIDMYGFVGRQLNERIGFTYDPMYEQYYMTAQARNYDNHLYHPATIDGSEVTGAFYMAAFDATTGNNLWWHQYSENYSGSLRDVVVDNSGDIYVTGSFDAILENGQISGYPSFGGVNFIAQGLQEPFCMKMNHNGQPKWISYPEGSYSRGEVIAVNDDGVFLGQGYGTFGGGGHYWDNVYFERPSGNGLDPVVVHLNKDTGEAIEIYDITSPGYGYNDEITAVTTDKLGNIVVGGYMQSAYLFEDHLTVPQMNKKQSNPSDFFIAQLNKDGVSCDDEILEISEMIKPVIQVWPNPTQGKLHINGDKPIDAIEIYNVLGQKVDVQFVTGVETNSIITDVSSLNTGVYFVKVYSLDNQQIFRVIKN